MALFSLLVCLLLLVVVLEFVLCGVFGRTSLRIPPLLLAFRTQNHFTLSDV